MRLVNLSTRPFRNERAPALAWSLMALLVLGGTAWHARVLVRVAGSRHVAREREVAQMEEEASRLRAEANPAKVPRPDPATVAQWSAIRDLVERRLFAWTRLLSQLEGVLPYSVRLTSITPTIEKGQVKLSLIAEANPAEDGLVLIDTLEAKGPFADVYPKSVDRREAAAIYTYDMRYVDRPEKGR